MASSAGRRSGSARGRGPGGFEDIEDEAAAAPAVDLKADEDASPYVRVVAKHMTQALLARTPHDDASAGAFATANLAVSRGEMPASRRIVTATDVNVAAAAARKAEKTLVEGKLAASWAFSFTRVTRYFAAAICEMCPANLAAAEAPATGVKAKKKAGSGGGGGGGGGGGEGGGGAGGERERGDCKYCSGSFALKLDGTLFAHKAKGSAEGCAGSGAFPN